MVPDADGLSDDESGDALNLCADAGPSCLVHRNDHDWATPIHGTWSGELLQHPARFLEVVQPQHGEAIPLGAGMRRKVVRVSGGRLFPGGFCGAFERCASGMAMAMKQRSLDYTNFEERRR